MRKFFAGLFVAVFAAALSLVGTGGAAAADPPSASCSAETVVRALQNTPTCTVTVQCPPSSPGCAFTSSVAATSQTTVATAQATLTLVDLDSYSSFTTTCSAPAAIVASGATAGCYAAGPTTFMPAGRRFQATCAWNGTTVSVSPRVTCAAAFFPLGGE